MAISVQEADFDLNAEIDSLVADNKDIGAIVNFVGTVRNINQGDKISTMILEHYPGMTEKSLKSIADQVRARWQLNGLRIIHRVGELEPGDNIVLVITASRHRKDAFAACEFIMDFLKTQAPFWKKEVAGNKQRWVESRKSDFDELKKWRKFE